MRTPSLLLALATPVFLSACAVAEVADTVSSPARIGLKAIDILTTTQAERDQKRGREIREREERLGQLQRQLLRETEECDDGDRGACKDARKTQEEIDELLPTIPVEPDD